MSSEPTARAANAYVLRPPTIADGHQMATLAWRSGALDRNSSYAYLLWCRDFAATSVVAEQHGSVAGFVTGYRRPDDRSTLFVWQVAVDEGHRGAGLARRLLDHLVDRVGPNALEATVTLDNAPSLALFASLARDHGAEQAVSLLFDESQFPDHHESEHVLRIAPLRRPPR